MAYAPVCFVGCYCYSAALAPDEFKRLVKEELGWLFLNDSVLVNFEYFVWLG